MKEIKITESKMSEALAQIDAMEAISSKNKGCLRLLTEEMFSLCTELLNVLTLDFEVKCEDGKYALCASMNTRVSETVKGELLTMSSSGKNAANKGVKGILGAVLDALSYGGDPDFYTTMSLGYGMGYGMKYTSRGYSTVWTLSEYMEFASRDEIRSDWDGMEKSIIANFADDVSIGVRSNKLEMVVTKNF